jgi:hypothetical protein
MKIVTATYSSVYALHVVHEVGQTADQVHRVDLAEGRVVLAEALCVIQQLLPARETREQRPLLSPYKTQIFHDLPIFFFILLRWQV